VHKLSAGLGSQWSITPVFEKNGFQVARESDYEGLFRLLAQEQIDYFPRGLNEIFDEYEQRKLQLPDLHIEESLALYVPLPTYFFVSPTKPELAERITSGLEAMIKDGSFEKLFLKYHGEMLRKANLRQRKLFTFDNPNLSPETPLNRKQLWLKAKP